MAADTIRITGLSLGVTLTGNELFEVVQGGLSKSITARYFPLCTDPFLTVTSKPELTNSRYLAAGANIAFSDAGPGGALTIIGSNGASTPIYWNVYQSITLAAGNTNDQVISATTQVVRVTPNAAGSSLTGIDSTANNGRILVLINVGAAGDLTLPNQSASSLAANRFTNVGGYDLVIPPGGSAQIWYDPVSTTWRPC